jgi:hypothetical protein
MTNIEQYLKENHTPLFGWNPFFKGYLSNKDRKLPIQKYCENFRFFCKHADLIGAPIEITPLFEDHPFMSPNWETALMHDIMEFMFEWREYVWSHLNGYSGFDKVRFEFDPSITINIDVKSLDGTPMTNYESI